jgi:hypothetical protein
VIKTLLDLVIQILLGFVFILIFTKLTNRFKILFPRFTIWLGDGDSDGSDDGDSSGDDSGGD